MYFDRRKLQAMLKWYMQELGKDIMAVLIVNYEGLLVEYITHPSEKLDENKFIGAFSALVDLILKRLTKDFELGTFGAGTFDTDEYRFIFCEAGDEHVFVTILNSLATVEPYFPYAYLAAEKVARIFDGRPVSPVIPKITTSEKDYNIRRKEGVFQKVKMQSTEYAYKLIMGGDSGVGKTSIVHRFVSNIFDDLMIYKATIGTAIIKKEIMVLNTKVRFVIWDLGGQKQFKRVRKMYLYNAEAGILVYDITNRESFENIKKWYEDFVNAPPSDKFIVLVGNKLDLKKSRAVSTLEGQELAKELGILFIETSAKTGENINEAFKMLALQILRNFFEAEEVSNIEISKAFTNEKERIRMEFWKNLVDKIRKELPQHASIEIQNKAWLEISAGREGLCYSYIIKDYYSGIELLLDHEDKSVNEARFKELEQKRDEIQREFREIAWHLSDDMEWNFDEKRNFQTIRYQFKNKGLESNKNIDAIQYFMIDAMRIFITCFQKYVNSLSI